MGANERESRFALQNGRFALSFKGRVNYRQLPAGRGFRRPDGVTASEEADVLDDVSRLVDACQCRAETELHVGEEAVLRISCSHSNSSRVSVLNLDVDVGERGIKGAGISVGNGSQGGLGVAGAAAAKAGAPSGKKEHHLFVRGLLEALAVGGQDDYRARGSVADYADAWPDVESLIDPIASWSEQNNTLATGLLDPIDGLLERSGIVTARRGGDIAGLGIFRSLFVVRGGPDQRRRSEGDQNESQTSNVSGNRLSAKRAQAAGEVGLSPFLSHGPQSTRVNGDVKSPGDRHHRVSSYSGYLKESTPEWHALFGFLKPLAAHTGTPFFPD